MPVLGTICRDEERFLPSSSGAQLHPPSHVCCCDRLRTRHRLRSRHAQSCNSGDFGSRYPKQHGKARARAAGESRHSSPGAARAKLNPPHPPRPPLARNIGDQLTVHTERPHPPSRDHTRFSGPRKGPLRRQPPCSALRDGPFDRGEVLLWLLCRRRFLLHAVVRGRGGNERESE